MKKNENLRKLIMERGGVAKAAKFCGVTRQMIYAALNGVYMGYWTSRRLAEFVDWQVSPESLVKPPPKPFDERISS